MIKFILSLFDLLAPLIRALHVDYPQFRAILETKLILDTRRRSNLAQTQPDSKGNKRKPRNVFLAMMFFYAFWGLILAGTLAMASPVAGAIVVNAFIMVMVGLSLIADFSSVLLDTTDNAVLQPRPVTGRTVLVARVAHIIVYLAALSLSISLVPMVIGSIKLGPLFPLVYLPMLACSVVFVVFLANLLYLAAMRLVSGERFRDLILYVQIGLSVLVFGSYQLMPRLMDVNMLKDWKLEGHSWLAYVWPPVWMAAPIDLLAGHTGPLQLLLTALAVAVPLAGLLVVVFILAPRFNRALLDLDASPAGASAGAAPHAAAHASLGSRLGRLLCRRPDQRAAFELLWILCGRDRQFKHRTYPAMAIALIVGFSFILSFGHNQGPLQSVIAASHTKADLYVLYFTCFMVPSILLQMRYSPHYQAAWIYEALPIRRPGDVLIAALKAVLARFILPAYAAVALVVAAIWRTSCLADLIFAAGAIVFISTFEAAFLARALPFSEAFGSMESSTRVGKTIGLMIIPAAIGGFHYLFSSNPPVLAIGLAVLLMFTWLLARYYTQITWEDLRRAA